MASLQEYLKRYTDSGVGQGQDDKKRKKRKKVRDGSAPVKKLVPGIIIHDEDAQWQKKIEEPTEEEEEFDEAPQELADADTRMKLRLDLLREQQAKTGSGWMEVGTAEALAKEGTGGKSSSAPDFSPPRRGRHDSPELSPPRKARHDLPGLSPPRKARHDSSEPSPPRRPRHDSPDISPPRKRRQQSPDLSPPHKTRIESLDLSPPQKARATSLDLSPPRKDRRSSPDLSPPRKRRHEIRDLSPVRQQKRSPLDPSPLKKSRHDSPDLAPPRKSRHDSPDLSPPRKSRHDSPDLSVPRRRARHDSPADSSPPRKPSDNLPGGEKNGQPRRMTDGTLAGLRTGKDLQSEIVAKRADDARRFAALDETVTGRGAGTVYRDKTGKKVTAEQLKAEAEAAAKKRKNEEPPPEWGKGMAQKRAAEGKARELEELRSKPFARTRDDKDLDSMLKSRSRWGDPMAHLVKNKGPSEDELGQLDTEEMKAQGFIVPQEVPPHSWIKRGLAPPYNRFGIRPGRHWDGVDRSTGFEKEIVKSKNAKQARANEAYLWSVSDM